jgi:hypothetical protein
MATCYAMKVAQVCNTARVDLYYGAHALAYRYHYKYVVGIETLLLQS